MSEAARLESLLTHAAEVGRLPGCGAKIAVLWEQWKDSGALHEVQEAAQDEKLSVLQTFYDIWGVGDSTAREFYKKGEFTQRERNHERSL